MTQQWGILGRLANWWGARRAAADAVAASTAPAALLDGLGWAEFLVRLGDGFRLRGYTVSTAEGGAGRLVDLVLSRGDERFLVDAKPWRSTSVGLAPVRLLHEQLKRHHASGAFVVTAGRYTDEAQQFARRHPVTLIDADALHELLHAREEKTQPIVRRDGPFADSTLPPGAWRVKAQPCPVCGGAMVETQRAGRRVWGCRHHPLCEGTRELTP